MTLKQNPDRKGGDLLIISLFWPRPNTQKVVAVSEARP